MKMFKYLCNQWKLTTWLPLRTEPRLPWIILDNFTVSFSRVCPTSFTPLLTTNDVKRGHLQCRASSLSQSCSSGTDFRSWLLCAEPFLKHAMCDLKSTWWLRVHHATQVNCRHGTEDWTRPALSGVQSPTSLCRPSPAAFSHKSTGDAPPRPSKRVDKASLFYSHYWVKSPFLSGFLWKKKCFQCLRKRLDFGSRRNGFLSYHSKSWTLGLPSSLPPFHFNF